MLVSVRSSSSTRSPTWATRAKKRVVDNDAGVGRKLTPALLFCQRQEFKVQFIMKHSSKVLWASLLVWCGMFACHFRLQGSQAHAATSTASSAVASRVPHDPNQARALATFWEQQVRRDREGALGWRNLADAYLSLARETGKIEPVVKAENAARQSLKLLPEKYNTMSLTVLTSALLTQHRFPEALAVADRAVAFDLDVHRLRADILLEMGRVSDAQKALANIPYKSDDLNRRALSARIAEATGHPAVAFKLMQEAARIVDTQPELPAETAAWYHTMVGHSLIDGGDLKAGEAACLRALKIFPRDYRAMTGLAEAAAWRRDWKSTIAWANKSHQISNQNPEILVILGDAYSELGQKQQSQKYYAAFEKLARSFPRIYDRNYALFLADRGYRLGEALAIARRDLSLRQDAGAYSTLAWVLFRQGKVKEADALMQRALQKSPQDAQTWYHAAMIARARRQKTTATKYFERVRRANPYFLKSVGLA